MVRKELEKMLQNSHLYVLDQPFIPSSIPAITNCTISVLNRGLKEQTAKLKSLEYMCTE